MVRLAEGLDPQPDAQALAGIDLDAAWRRLPGLASANRRRRARAVGGAPSRRPARRPCLASRFALKWRPARQCPERNVRSTAPDQLRHEGSHAEQPDDASRGSRESCSWSKASTGREDDAACPCWQRARAPPAIRCSSPTEWNSSALVKAATKSGKKKNSLTPMTFSLLHATDFADRLLYNIIPPLKADMIVLADRYVYTAFSVMRRAVSIGEPARAEPSRSSWTSRCTSACRSKCRPIACCAARQAQVLRSRPWIWAGAAMRSRASRFFQGEGAQGERSDRL